jgi:hypothetical protein
MSSTVVLGGGYAGYKGAELGAFARFGTAGEEKADA